MEKTIQYALLISFTLVILCPVIVICIYVHKQSQKKLECPKVLGISEALRQNIEDCFKRVNGWLDLEMLYMAVYYILNIWSVCFSLLTFIVIVSNKVNVVVWIASLPAIASVLTATLNLIVRPKEMFLRANNSWNKAQTAAISFRLKIIGKSEDEIKIDINELHEKLSQISREMDFIY